MIALVAQRKQKVGIALRALAGYFSYIKRAVFNFISKKYSIFFPHVGMMTSQIIVPVTGNVVGICTLTSSSYLPFLRCFLLRTSCCMSEKS